MKKTITYEVNKQRVQREITYIPFRYILAALITLFEVLAVIGKYKAGKYKQIPDLIRHFRTDKLRITCDGPTSINLDGELRTAQTVEISVAKEKIRFFYPKELTWKVAPAEEKETVQV